MAINYPHLTAVKHMYTVTLLKALATHSTFSLPDLRVLALKLTVLNDCSSAKPLLWHISVFVECLFTESL